MTPLAEAIMARYNSGAGAAFKAVTPGGLWLEDAPQFADEADKKDYAVFGFPNIGHEETFTSNMEDPLVQFTLVSFDRDAKAVGDMFTKLKALFDQCELTVAGFDFIEMRRDVSNLVRDPEDDAWDFMVDYQVQLQKQ